ncbi:MAG: aminotransferase class I/II-fold pyridoxal phosphate-dependent enzyme [Candidatus Delongbacteria bacterium]
MRFNTRAIHAGNQVDPLTGAICQPIFQSSTFVQEDIGVTRGYDYSRAGNPTRSALEANLAALENARHGHAFSSGLAALQGLMHLLRQGDELVCSAGVYGGTWRFLTQVMEPWGLRSRFVDTAELDQVRAALTPATRLLFVETPTNPMMRLSDIRALAALCKERGVLLVVDNTFLSPYFQSPLALGADIVLHSCTKYLGGHSDMIMGVLMHNSDELQTKLAFVQKSAGAVPGPFECFLLLRSTKTLGVRMERHFENALRVAHYLEEHPAVTAVHYPGLPTHPQHDLAQRQMQGYGGMLSFELKNYEAARTVARALKIFSLAESLGGVESLVNHPVGMTHASVPRAQRESYGLTDALLRLSVGIEDVQDLVDDLAQALALAN